MPLKRIHLNVKKLPTKLHKKTVTTSVYVPTPIAELERQKNNEKKLKQEKEQLRLKRG